MSGSRVSYKLTDFAKSLPEIEFKFYCEKIEELKCNDPLVIDLHLFKSGSDLKKLIPPITRDHLIVYLIVERRGSDGEKVEAVNNFLASEQYLTNTFSDQLLAFPLTNGTVIIRSHITHSQTLSAKPATPWAALLSDGKIFVAFCDCLAG